MIKLKELLWAFTALGAASLGAMSTAAPQEGYPKQPIKMIIANPPGGVGDIVGRVLGEKVGADLGQAVVIENRSGGTTVIGTQAVARAKPDGYTILNLTASGVVVSVLREDLPYNLERDFTPIIGVGSFPMALTVSSESNIKSIDELTTAVRSGDGVNYASGGAGTLAHLAAVRLLNELKGTGTHVPYRGNNDAIQGLLGNQVQLFFPTTAEALPLAKSGRIRVLAVTSEQRFPGLPDVPTTKELGFSDFNPRVWHAFMAPANTSASIVSRLHDTFAKAIMDPAVQERLAAVGFTPEIKRSRSSIRFHEGRSSSLEQGHQGK